MHECARCGNRFMPINKRNRRYCYEVECEEAREKERVMTATENRKKKDGPKWWQKYHEARKLRMKGLI